MQKDTKPNRKHTNRGSQNPSVRKAYLLREITTETGIPMSTLRNLIRKGTINPITGFGRRWLISAEEYRRLLDTRLRRG
jgi:predicted site-specific integrase-resolvase